MTDGGVEGVVAMQEYILCERCCAREPLDANLNYSEIALSLFIPGLELQGFLKVQCYYVKGNKFIG